MNRTKIFFDTEFTSLSKSADLISIGCVSETGETFYAEFSDIDVSLLDQWIVKNVLSNCKYINSNTLNDNELYMYDKISKSTECFGNKVFVKQKLIDWLNQFENQGVEMWGDCLQYDWVLFNDLWDNALKAPAFLFYIPFDICTLFKLKGIDPNINREEFVGIKPDKNIKKHNSLWDSFIIKKCYEKLNKDYM